jgi:3-deoxy-D-manno-octulosonic-acid transferase
MYLVYTFLLYAGLVLTLPWYALKFRKYLPTLKDRLGFQKIPTLRRSVWVHAVSVGEVKSVRKLVQKLRSVHSGQPLILSTITPAGQELASSTRDLADYVFYFPLDLPGAIRRTLDRVNPELVLIAETEIWPNFLRECRKRGIRVVMVNGRISDRSLPRYRVVRRWLKRVLNDYTLLGMQTETDRERIESIGADGRKVEVFGNLKYDALDLQHTLSPDLSDMLSSMMPLWIAASTMPGEDELILDAFSRLRKHHGHLTLLIAPRHPDRFDSVERLIRERGLRCTRRTRLERGADVLLLDSVGELASTFRYASVVFVGGSLVPRGGHNILEPAAFSNPILFGPHMENFREIRDLFIGAHAAIEVQNAEELATAIDRLLSDTQQAAALGARARQVVEENTGATERVLAYLQ